MQEIPLGVAAARFIAHVQADGCFSPERNNFRYFNKDLDLINDFKNSALFAFIICCNKPYKGKTCYHIGFRNKKLSVYLKKFRFGCKEWIVPEFVINGDLLIRSAYLQAFFDDESSVTYRRRKEGADRFIRLQSINKIGICQLQELLIQFGIKPKLYGPLRHKYFELKIMGKENLILFQNWISFVNKNKKLKLMNAIRTYQN